jgi:glycosyltransferase involved in cell wall biosynthesis
LQRARKTERAAEKMSKSDHSHAGGRKRAVFLINSLAGGGAERVMCTLLRHSTDERDEFDITLALLDDEPAANTPPDWVEVRQLDCRRSFKRSLIGVRRLYAELKPDVAVSFLTRANISNVMNARFPCVISERVNTTAHFPAGLRGALSRAVVRAIYPRANRVIAVSDGVAQDLRDNYGVRPERLISIPNPVDIDAILALASQPPALEIDSPYVFAVGRLVKSKNFAMLIRAFAAAKLSAKLVIAGEGGERGALEQLVAELGIADRVLLPGFIANPYPLMRRSDLFVLSSSAEGFPNALVEAMAVGAPVIATNCASGPSEILAHTPRETIKDMIFAPHGLIVPTDSVERMTDALRAMEEDPERRRGYGEKAAIRARAFSAKAAKDRYWDVVRAALAER